MEIWLDTTDKDHINLAKEMGVLHGVTTNPSIAASSNMPFVELLNRLLDIQEGPVAAQVIADDTQGMIEQGQFLREFSHRIVVKIPVTTSGIQAISSLKNLGVKVLATAIFEPYQALLAFKAGADYLAPYIGKIGDLRQDPLEVLNTILAIKRNYGFEGKVMAAGIRSPEYVTTCAQMGTCAITLPAKVFKALTAEHEAIEQAMAEFSQDWTEANMGDFPQALSPAR